MQDRAVLRQNDLLFTRSVSDKFIELFLEHLNKLKSGDPTDYETNIGPLASVQQAETVEEPGKKDLLKWVQGYYTEVSGRMLSIHPHVLLDVHPGMAVFDEEVFGPVAPIIIAKDTAEAIALANMTKFGLGVSLFTNDLEKARKMVSEFKDGAVFINELVKSDPRLPFGGTGRSGYGRELAIHGIREFVNVKTVYTKKL